MRLNPPPRPLPSFCPGNPQRRGSAAKNLAKSKSTAVVKFSPTPVGLTPAEMTVGPGGDDNSFSSVNPMSPVILPSGRRATVGPAGAGIANKFEERSRGEPLGMKKAKSMQVRSLRWTSVCSRLGRGRASMRAVSSLFLYGDMS